MKSTYDIFPDRNLFVKTHRGEATVDDEIELLTAVFTDSRYRTGMNGICDYTDASGNLTLPQLDRLRAFISQKKHIAGDCRWALVFPKGKDKSTARIFIALHDAFEDTIDVKLFETMEEAEAWATGSDTGS